MTECWICVTPTGTSYRRTFRNSASQAYGGIVEASRKGEDGIWSQQSSSVRKRHIFLVTKYVYCCSQHQYETP